MVRQTALILQEDYAGQQATDDLRQQIQRQGAKTQAEVGISAVHATIIRILEYGLEEDVADHVRLLEE